MDNKALNKDDALNRKNEEIENWKIKLQHSEKDYEDLQKRYNVMEVEKAKLAAAVKALSEESDYLKAKAVAGEQQSLSVSDLQNKLYMITAEHDRLLFENESLKARSPYDGGLKLSSSEAERLAMQKENAALKQKIDSLHADNVKLAQMAASASPEKNKDQTADSTMKSQNSLWDGINLKGAIGLTLLTVEIERLHEVICEIEASNNEQIEEIRNECQRLVDASEDRVIELELEIDRLKLREQDGNDRYEQVDEEDYQDHDQENDENHHLHH